LYYWFPKMSGRFMDERLGKVHFWLTMIAFNLTFLPMHWTGLLGMPRRVYTYDPILGVTALNQMSTIGSYLLGVSIVLLLINLIRSARHGARAGADPWGGSTLEWSIPSPPPPYNFVEVPTVHSRTPLWEETQAAPTGPEEASSTMQVTTAGHEVGQAEMPDDASHGEHGSGHGIHMPNPSYYPPLAALGLFGIFGGLLVTPLISVCGLALLLFSIYGWCLEPAS
jgi:heme/copper-type cytochrome/quinol oxidase subunit 1